MLTAGLKAGQLKSLLGDLSQVFFVSEAWSSKINQKDFEQGAYSQPSLDPKRIEILLVSGIDPTSKKNMFAALELIRDKNDKIIDTKKFGGGKPLQGKNSLLEAFVMGYNKAEAVQNRSQAVA